MKRKNHGEKQHCAICDKTYAAKDLVAGGVIRPPVAELIRQVHPDWSADKFICRHDLATFRTQYVHSLLETDRGELTSIEDDVIRSLQEHEMLSRDVDAQFEQQWTLGERLADKIASFGGSWSFLMLFGFFLAAWIVMNSLVLLQRPVDPYPYILLNLVLSCLAAIQAPVIMMSQNRQEAKDRLRAQYDYRVNLKAELEIRQLHEKVDHLLSHQWERLVEIQELQMDLLAEIEKEKP